jgi:hypothetical protein
VVNADSLRALSPVSPNTTPSCRTALSNSLGMVGSAFREAHGSQILIVCPRSSCDRFPTPRPAPRDNMTCCCVWPLERADSQPLPRRRRHRADARKSARVEETHLREWGRPAASGEQDDGPDRSLAQGDLRPDCHLPLRPLRAASEFVVKMSPRTLAVTRGPLPVLLVRPPALLGALFRAKLCRRKGGRHAGLHPQARTGRILGVHS